ncbi:MAG TPA: chemotaxis protein CheB [Oligoflexus sp.]|uniref:chemotaxis protein CheB n=1 Tax=Oligoflexus sp. TaxID=1971216 RepID=UPI002D66E401|nr:chemotaxis protein CheB [Oligoflexus sp.]HYX36376.1 chemotaxis protein CheB [Oligoflexus sp.]
MRKVGSTGAVVMGSSAGGMNALRKILRLLPADFALPILIVQHFPSDTPMLLPALLRSDCLLPVKEATDKSPIEAGHVYLAPPGYHLLVEEDHTLALSEDELVNWSRPSIDVLFESASLAFRTELIGIVLTGANHDGAHGLRMIKERGGLALVQDPDTAEARTMPQAAIDATPVDHVATLETIGMLLARQKGSTDA